MLLQTYKLTGGSSNLKAQHKVYVKEKKEKSVTFTKGKSKFLQDHREWGGDFSMENLGLFFQS